MIMQTMQLQQPAAIESEPLVRQAQPQLTELPPRSLLLRVKACGVCHTDLHIVEGELAPKQLPIVPGHEVVATVEQVGESATEYAVGDRVGVPWLYSSCGVCEYCQRGQENLCALARFTGWHVDGGYAEYMIADADFVVPIPAVFSDAKAAPLLCAGIIGYRSLRQARVKPGERVGLIGFGASAHLAIQIARHWNCPVEVFTRSEEHQALARSLGAEWAGRIEDQPPHQVDHAVIFAPLGKLVAPTLAQLRRGGTLAINAIHMSPIPELDYQLLYGERTVRSVTNATRRDAQEFMQLAAEILIKPEVETFPLEQANQVLLRLKHSEINGAAVLLP
jgi:propanol-preferring alcohol dehydrogenase